MKLTARSGVTRDRSERQYRVRLPGAALDPSELVAIFIIGIIAAAMIIDALR